MNNSIVQLFPFYHFTRLFLFYKRKLDRELAHKRSKSIFHSLSTFHRAIWIIWWIKKIKKYLKRKNKNKNGMKTAEQKAAKKCFHVMYVIYNPNL